MNPCSVWYISVGRIMASHAVCHTGSAIAVASNKRELRSCWVRIIHLWNKVDVLILDLWSTTDLFDTEVWLLWFFRLGWWWRWNILLLLFEMSEILHSNIFHVMWLKLFSVASKRHITRDSAEENKDEEANDQETLNNNDDDTDYRCWYSCYMK